MTQLRVRRRHGDSADEVNNTNPLPVAIMEPAPVSAGFVVGTKSLTTTVAAQLATNQGCREITIQNDPDNTNDILVGDGANQVIQLIPGQALTVEVSNVNLVWAKNATSSTQTVNWWATR